MTKVLMTGSEAAALSAKMSNIEVLSYYPITPAFPAMERISKYIDDGELNCKFIRVESDHSALAAVLGASLAGARSYTVTNSQGLLYMTEVCYHVAGLRQPIVMGVANRALSAPHSRFPEHGDAISQGASGWIQLFCENNQNIFDDTIQAFKIAEELRLPVMVNYEGYIQSHTSEEVEVPDAEKVKTFLPLKRMPVMDINNPMGVNTVTGPDLYMTYKYRQNEAMTQALSLIPEVASNFSTEFGRNVAGLYEAYKMEDAEHAIVAMGSIVSTSRQLVDRLRSQGKKIGLIKLRAWRPFPREALVQQLRGVKYITVLDKNIVFGVGGAVATDLKAALFGKSNAIINGCILGLGGAKCGQAEIEQAVESTENQREQPYSSVWIGL